MLTDLLQSHKTKPGKKVAESREDKTTLPYHSNETSMQLSQHKTKTYHKPAAWGLQHT